jgi:hypothetical protein
MDQTRMPRSSTARAVVLRASSVGAVASPAHLASWITTVVIPGVTVTVLVEAS